MVFPALLSDRAHGAGEGDPGQPPGGVPPSPALRSPLAARRRPGHYRMTPAPPYPGWWYRSPPVATGADVSIA